MRIYRIVVLCALALPGSLAAQADSARTDSAQADSTRADRAALVTQARVPGRLFRTFRNDNPEHLLGVVPGVVLRGTETGLASASELAIRGGTPGYASTYIDGAPVRFHILGNLALGLGTGSLDAANVTTGPPDLSLPDFQDGVIEYVARSGSERFSGSFHALTDGAFESGVGYNRFEGGLGGPLPLAGATWFVGGTLIGQESHYVGMGAEDVPEYLPAGIDTTVVVGGTNHDLPAFVDQRAYDWGTELRGHAKVVIPTGAASQLAFTGVVNQMQERFFPGPWVLTPSLYTGVRSTGRLLAANWSAPLGGGDSRFRLRVHGSIGSSEYLAGLLEPASEAASADPALGITLETLRFTGEDSIPFPGLEQIVRNVRTNSGTRVPFLNHDELRNVQDSRGNPYGMETSWAEQGLDGPLAKTWERRAEVRGTLDWNVGTGHVLSVTANLSDVDLSFYVASLLRQSFMDVYQSGQGRVGVAVADRLARGLWRAALALRFDHFGSAGLFPDTPGRIYTNPQFNRPAAITSDTGYTNSVARVMTPGEARDALSARAAVEHDLTSRTVVRGAIGYWVTPPSLHVVLTGSNSDLDFTNSNDFFGRDVDYGYTTLIEIGGRSQLTDQLVGDFSVYSQARPQYVGGIVPYNDPANPGDVVNLYTLVASDLADWGIDLALDWRLGSWFNLRGAYGVRQTSADPGASNYWTQAIGAAAVLRPHGGMLDGVEVAALARLVSGQPYTRLDPSGGTGALAIGSRIGRFIPAAEPYNSSQTPWVNTIDLRLSKAVRLGRLDLRGIADFRNLLNLQNVLNLFAETGEVVNYNHRGNVLDVEFQNLEREAADNGRLLPNGDINLVPNCDSWTITSGVNGAVVNCVALRRSEVRFGNGDGLYSPAERQTALHTFYNAFYGPHQFYGAGRSVRLGLEISW